MFHQATHIRKPRLALVMLFPPCVVLAQPTPAAGVEETVIIWRRVRNDFHNVDISPQQIDAIVRAAPPKTLSIPPGSSLSQELQKSFRISSTFTPTMYNSVISRVMTLNGLASPHTIAAGTALQVPAIPVVGKQYRRAPPSAGQNVTLALSAVPGTVKSVAPAGIAPQFELQYIAVPASRASEYVLPGVPEQGRTGALSVRLAQASGTAAANRTLTPQMAERIKSRLQAAGGPRPVLVIVDDAVPDNAEYAKSKRFVLQMSDKLRSNYALGAPSKYYKAVADLPAALTAPEPDSLYPKLKRHASLIKHALVEFTDLDPQNQIEVVYLPLAATQLGVGAMLQEVLYLAELLKITRPTEGHIISADAGQRQAAEQVVDETIARNRSVLDYGPVALASGQELALNTDRALLEGYGIALSYFSDAARRPHAFSFSWTAAPLVYPLFFVSAPYGWKFAAAGNRGNSAQEVDFLRDKLEFASRAASTKDVVAVLNSNGSGTKCASNVFDDKGLSVLSLSYPGDVDASFCGTSFSTPRAAWLVAAKEAAAGKALSPFGELEKLVWLQRQQASLLGIKQEAKPLLMDRYRLDPARLFD